MQEYAAQTYGCAVHEYELARHLDGSLLLQRFVHGEGLPAAILTGRGPVGDLTLAVVEQRAVDEARPDVQGIDELCRQTAEAPGFVGIDDEVALAPQEALIEIDHPLHEGGWEGADAAVVEEVDACGHPKGAVLRCGLAVAASPVDFENRVVAEVWVAMDHAEVGERIPPGAEHGARNGIAMRKRRVPVVHQPPAFQPGHGQQALGRELGQDLGNANGGLVRKDRTVEPRMAGLELVIELLAQPRRDLL